MINKRFKSIIRWTIAIGCLAYIAFFFWQQQEHLQVVVSLNPGLIVLVLVLLLSYYPLQSFRYHLVIEKCSGVGVPVWIWFRIFILGLFLNNFVPQMGNVYRSIRLKREYNVSFTRYISAYLSFAWMDTCLNMMIATLVVVITEPDLQLSGINAIFLLIVLTTTIAISPVLVLKISRLFKLKAKPTFWIQSKLSEVFEVTVENLHDQQYILKMLVFGLAAFIQMCLTFYVCFRCFGMHLTLPAMSLFYALFKMSTYLNVTPGNLGIRELAYGILSEQLNIGMAEGILVSAVFRILAYIVLFSLAIMMGGLNLLRHREEYQRREIKPEL